MTDTAAHAPGRRARAGPFRRHRAWLALVRDKEIRIVSRRGAAAADAYAVTVLGLSGDVLVQIDERFWLDTPAPVRRAEIAAHIDDVRSEIGSMRSPAKLIGAVVTTFRMVVTLASGGWPAVNIWFDGWASAASTGTWIALAAFVVAWITPTRAITRLATPLVRWYLRRLLGTRPT